MQNDYPKKVFFTPTPYPSTKKVLKCLKNAYFTFLKKGYIVCIVVFIVCAYVMVCTCFFVVCKELFLFAVCILYCVCVCVLYENLF